MGIGTVVLATAAVLTYPATEAIRSVVHRRRERLHGIGGTQDIAVAGAAVAFVLAVLALVHVVRVAHALGR